MPITLKVVSWNLRTFGIPKVPAAALDYIADIIVGDLNPDIVCLQEIQIGSYVGRTIGSKISVGITSQLDDLLNRLMTRQPLANWFYTVSGTNNSARAKSMTDAYAFFCKGTPSAQSHANAPYAITFLQAPRILRQNRYGGDKFPGRRPGLITLDVTPTSGEPPVPFNIISWHAPTPCNTFGKTKHTTSSGRAINALATLDDIGGSMQIYRTVDGVRDYIFERQGPLPQIDTIILGDFNYRMDINYSDFVYRNLTDNFQPCVSTYRNTVLTTYSPDPNKPFQGSSSYDNIFVLKPHRNFRPGLSFTGNGGSFDFIAAAARAYNVVQPWTYAEMEEAWYVCYGEGYKLQYSKPGVSDHLPVWAEITVTQSSLGNSHIKATSSDGDNGVFHALFGVAFPGFDGPVYYDGQAALHRQQFATYLVNTITPMGFATIRTPVVAAMIRYFATTPDYLASAKFLVTNPTFNPFGTDRWTEMVAAYIQGILGGRPIMVEELDLLALCFNSTIKLWFIDDAEYKSRIINDGQVNRGEIYQSGQSFFRYQP